MIRTQIYIPEEIHQATKLLAQKQGKTLTELIRNFITTGVIEEKKKKRKQRSLSSLARLGISGGPKDLSKNIDKYLYGNKK